MNEFKADPSGISPNDMFCGAGRYAYRVADNSMSDIGIRAGDYVVIQKVEKLAHGDIGEVSLDGNISLRRIMYENDNKTAVLHTEDGNPPVKLPASEMKVHGRLVGLMRTYIYG